MGLFKSLYSDILKPVVSPVAKPILQGFEYYNRYVNEPLTFHAKMAIEHPEILWSNRAYLEQLRKKGIETHPGDNPLNIILRAGKDKRIAAAIEADLAKLPLYYRIPLSIASDPLTYATLGWGAIGKGLAQGGLRGALAATSRELLYQTGIPHGVALAKAPYRIYRGQRLGELRRMISAHEAVKSIEGVTQPTEELVNAEKLLREAIRQEHELGFFSRRRVGTAQNIERAWQALGKVMEKEMDSRLLKADIYNNARWRFGAAGKLGYSLENVDLLGQLVLPLDELKASVKTDTIRSLGALQKGIQKLPRPLRGIWTALDPSQRQFMMENPKVFESWLFRNKFIERGESADLALGALMSQWQKKVGLETEIAVIEGAGATPVLKKPLALRSDVPTAIARELRFDAKKRPVLEDVMRWGPKAFDMTDEQLLFWNRSHELLQERIADFKKYMLEIPEFKMELKKNKELAESFAQMGKSLPDGSLYWPRVALYQAEPHVVSSQFRPSLLGKVLERVPGLTAYSDMPVPAGFKRVTEVRTRLGSEQAFEHLRQLEAPEEARRFIWSGDVGHTLATRFRELAIAAADETILPALRWAGWTPSRLVTPDLIAAVEQTKKRLDLLGKSRNTLEGILKSRNVNARTAKAFETLKAAAARTENTDLENLLAAIAKSANEHIQLTASLPPEAQKAALNLALSGGNKKDEQAFVSAVKKAMGRKAGDNAIVGYLLSRHEFNDLITYSRDHVNNMVRIARIDLKEGRRAIKAAQKNGQTFLGLRQSGVPALSGYLYDEKMAKEIGKLFGGQAGAGEAALRTAAAMQMPLQTILTGGDLSYVFLQGMAAISNPAGFARSLALGIKQMFNRESYLEYLRSLGKTVNPQSGRTVLEEATRANVRLVGTELYHATEALSAIGVQGGRLFTLSEFLNRLPWNRAYAAGRNVAALELFRAQAALEGRLLGRALTDEELRGVGRQVNLATGAVSMKEIGMGAGQAAMERAFGRLGVQWFRSQTGRLVQAFNMGQIEGRVARRLLMQQLAAMTALYIATAELFDQVPQLDPTKPHFGQLRIGNVWAGFGGIYPSMMRAVFKTGQAIDQGDWERFKDIKEGRDPILNFWHGGAPLIGRLIADAVFEVNQDTRYGNLMQHPEEAVMPISVQSAIEGLGGTISPKEAVLQGVLSGAGLSTNPITAVEYFQDVSNRIAQEHGYQDWKSVPAAVQEDLRRANPDLQKAFEERDRYYQAKGQTPADRAFEQREQNINAIQDIMVGLWERVQRGEITKSEWRQRMSELWGEHGRIMDILFKEVPERKKEPEVLQDRLAIAYQSVRPEAFDANGDGVIEEAEWAAWREARRQWWEDHPEAKEFESYIKYEYPVRLFSDPVMRDAEMERRRMQDVYDEFLQISKYRGLSLEDGQVVDALRGLRTSISQELRFELARRGVPVEKIKIPSRVLWQLSLKVALQQGLKISPLLMKYAILLDNDKFRKKAINPERAVFLLKNRDLLDWYPQARQDAGLTDIGALRLGLVSEPSGTPVEERLTALAGAIQ